MSFPLIAVPQRPAVSLSFTDSDQTSTGATTHTFSSKSLGAASSSRHIVIGAGWRRSTTSPTLTSITVGGVTCTVPSGTLLDGTVAGCALGIAAVPTGTTGDIVVTLSHSGSCGIGVWALYNVESATPEGTVENSGSSVSSLAIGSLTTPNSGAAIFYAVGDGGTRTFTWTNPSENFDATISGGTGTTHTGASVLTTGASISETLNASGSTTIYAVAASWR